MYVPPIYRAEDPGWARFVMANYPLATLVTNGTTLPHATHLPVIFEQDGGDSDGLAGITLLGHMNRANPHWGALTEGTTGKLIFSGPHSYITPTVYHAQVAAPTWNFVAVHLQGTLRPFPQLDDTLRVLRRTVEIFESLFGDSWDPVPSLRYFRQIGTRVGAFRFTVTSADAMFKLSQEKAPEVRDRIIKRLGSAESGTAGDLSTLMRRFGLGSGADAWRRSPQGGANP